MKRHGRAFGTLLLLACLLFFLRIASAHDTEGVKSEIYSKLYCCPCNKGFARCLCQEAKEMKAYIDALLEEGVKKEEIYYRIAKKYSLKAITDARIKTEIENRITSETKDKRPQISLLPGSFDFGRIPRSGKTVKKIFKLYNKGSDNLIVTNIKTSCGCVNASLLVEENKSPLFGTNGASAGWKAIIGPGGLAEVEVVIDLQHPSITPGRLIREVFIYTNDPLYPETTLVLEGEVVLYSSR